MKLHQLLTVIAIPLIFSGCITSKQYRQTKAELLGYQYSYQSNRRSLDSMQQLVTHYQNLLADNQGDNRLAELEDLLAQREAALFEINQTIEDALSGFNGQGVKVTRRDGRVYVSLEEKLLFESGKAELSEEGIKAIKKVAHALGNNPNINITVEGHTDNKGYIAKPDAQIVDNWDLSCKRATEVIRYMTKNGAVNPKRIIASGRAQYFPVINRDTPEARAANRRTEIILTPNIDHIWDLLNKQ